MKEPVRILCVDDEVNVLKALQRLFLDEDYEILSAASADEGLEILKASPTIQIIVSDYRMPGLNGVDFLREVYRYWPETVRIVLSGYADTAAVVSAINEGHIYKFIPKPWNDDELKVTISNAVERYFLHKRNVELMESLADSNSELQILNENLEKLVRERTQELILRNRVLTYSQIILDSLPIAVVGLDMDGRVLQCNRNGRTLLDITDSASLGRDRRDMLPAEINRFIDTIQPGDEAVGRVLINGAQVVVRGVFIKHEEQEGIILVVEEGV